MALRNDGEINAEKFAPGFKLKPYIKRIFDVSAATVGLVLFAPVLFVVSVAIAVELTGPILIRETRYGYKGPIRVFKFRLDGPGRNRSDDRTTWIGQLVRSSGIDELPQLLNVLCGDMSIVGPRAYHSARDLSLSTLSKVKPGMTGWAQISGRREDFEATHQRFREDLRYVENWTLFLDVKIILAALFSRKVNL